MCIIWVLTELPAGTISELQEERASILTHARKTLLTTVYIREIYREDQTFAQEMKDFSYFSLLLYSTLEELK